MPTQTCGPKLPDKETLTRGLTAVLSQNGFARGRLTIERREPTIYSTSFPCEIVRCRFNGGNTVTLFCKYAAHEGSDSHGQRGGVAYETEVYRQVLQPSKASTPTFYGAYTDPDTGRRWLILEYVKRSLRVSKVPNPEAMKLAARWIGQFHAINERRLQTSPMPFLTRYDAEYYRGWATRTLRFANNGRRRLPWLGAVCRQLSKPLSSLSGSPQTVIHGEYYPHNILFQQGVIRPVDWETAAIAPGEIDLATITDGWPRESVQRFELEYQGARWPEAPPAGFRPTLDLARVYVQLRWLGDRPEWTQQRGSLWRFNQLYALSKRLGLL